MGDALDSFYDGCISQQQQQTRRGDEACVKMRQRLQKLGVGEEEGGRGRRRDAGDGVDGEATRE